jgi:hypothetical protein
VRPQSAVVEFVGYFRAELQMKIKVSRAILAQSFVAAMLSATLRALARAKAAGNRMLRSSNPDACLTGTDLVVYRAGYESGLKEEPYYNPHGRDSRFSGIYKRGYDRGMADGMPW